jgi:carboxypeptidase Q
MYTSLTKSRALPFLLPMIFALCLAAQRPIAQSSSWLDGYRDQAARLIAESQSSPFAWERLALLGDTFGHRLSGSEALESAIQWAVAEMKKDGLDNVRAEPVKVPHWVRGQESVEITYPHRSALVMLGLGNSVGTPADGIEAEALVVRSFAELDAAGAAVKGKIVVFNVSFTTYGETVQYRAAGPSRAAGLGAAAMLIRAVGPPGLRTPHTGSLRYADGTPHIPAAAIAAAEPGHQGPAPAEDGSEVPP